MATRLTTVGLGGGVLLLAVTGGGLLFLRRPSQGIADIIREVQPGWTESMVLERFPSVKKSADENINRDYPGMNLHELKLEDGRDTTAVVTCIGAIVVEVSTVALIRDSNKGIVDASVKSVWGDALKAEEEYALAHPSAKTLQEVAESNAQSKREEAQLSQEEAQRAQASQEQLRRTNDLDQQIAAVTDKIYALESQKSDTGIWTDNDGSEDARHRVESRKAELDAQIAPLQEQKRLLEARLQSIRGY